MSATDLTFPVVSPTRVVHAVRPGIEATACGLNFRRKRRRAQNGQTGWLRIKASFDQVAGSPNRSICKRCVECLDAGMGPGA